jgi:hypothetical protein
MVVANIMVSRGQDCSVQVLVRPERTRVLKSNGATLLLTRGDLAVHGTSTSYAAK